MAAADHYTGAKFHLVFPEGEDARVHAAAAQITERGWADVTLIVSAAPRRRSGSVARLSVERLAGMLPEQDRGGSLSRLTAAAVRCGHFDGAVLGATTHSREVLSAGLAELTAMRGTRVSGAVWVDATAVSGREMIFVDPSVNLRPDADTLASGLGGSAELFEFVVGRPAHIGLASWSGLGSPDPDPGYAAVVDRLSERGRPVVGGRPLQADALLDATVAHYKGVFDEAWSPVDVLGFPDLNAANICTKIVEYVGGSPTCAFNVGFDRPFNDVSRGISAAGLIAAGALTAVQCACQATVATTTCRM